MQPAGRDGTAPDVAAATAEEEALKRNTDCVYFLASPLTCKKGVECEYRHSEGARVNPRDCRYWLNGNCLNPKCLFRHPPLDGLTRTCTTLGMHSGDTSTRLPVSYSYLPAAHYPNKQNIPCYYFQKGACLKGDLCSFMHGPESKKAPSVKQQVPKVSTHESTPPPLMMKASPTQDKFASQKFAAAKYDSSVDVACFSGEPSIKAQIPPASVLLQKDNIQPDIEYSKSQTNNVPVSGGTEPSRHLSHHSEVVINDDLQDNGEGEEFLHESSPGFDVLVDGLTESPMYFHNGQDFPETSVHDMGLNIASDFVSHHASDDDTTVRHESWQFNEMDEYGQYMGVHDHHRRRHHEFSPERHGRISMSNRRRRSRVEETPTEFDASDLRHRLQKKRMLNGSRPSISPDRREPYRNDGRHVEKCTSDDYSSCREQRVPREVPISKRLQGRITLPTRSAGENRGDFHFGEEIGRGRGKGRISPGRLTEYHHGRLHNRINLRQHNEDFSSEEGKPAVRSVQRDEVILDFAGPKSLSELKVHKSAMKKGRGSVDDGSGVLSREEKYMKLGRPLGHEEAESCTFEGPKPLSMILKRKRQLLNCAKPSNGDGRDNNEVDQASILGAATVSSSAMHVRVGQSLDSEQEDGDNYRNTEDSENRVVGMQEKVRIPADPGMHHQTQSSSQEEACEMEDDEIQHVENAEFEKYDEGDGEFEYEVDEGEEFKAEDYDNACPDNEEFFEEGSNFNEKFGVVFS